MAHPTSSFEDNWGAPLSSFLEVHLLPKKLYRTALRRRTVQETSINNERVDRDGKMQRPLSALAFAMMGVGTIVATGIFSFLPYICASRGFLLNGKWGAHSYACNALADAKVTGPAVVLSLLLAAGTAALSGLCYSEFACEFPLTGGGFLYTMLVFGEFPAALCAINLLIDYIFGTAAVVRNLSAYMSILFLKDVSKARHCGTVLRYDDYGNPSKWAGWCNMFQYAPLEPSFFASSGVVDYPAAICTLLFGIAICVSVKFFDHGNIGIQFVHIGLVVITFLAAFSNKQSSGDHFHPFYPVSDYDYATQTKAIGGTPSTMVISGAANIFFVFVGYDVIALGAEEGKYPTSMPYGTVGAIGIVTALYILMACALVMLIPHEELSAKPTDTIVAAFAWAFEVKQMHWARYIVALGAVIGICTSTATGLYGMSRIFQVFARERLFPPWLGRVHARTGTPIFATLFSTLIVMCFSFFSDFATSAWPCVREQRMRSPLAR